MTTKDQIEAAAQVFADQWKIVAIKEIGDPVFELGDETVKDIKRRLSIGFKTGALWMQETLKQQEAVCRAQMEKLIEQREREAYSMGQVNQWNRTFEDWKRSIEAIEQKEQEK